jgi:hypothetical protein
MNSDEINRTIDFILQSQSNAATRMDEMEKRHHELEESTSRKVQELSESTTRFQDEMRGFREDMKGFIRVLVPLLENHSNRLDRLEGQT